MNFIYTGSKQLFERTIVRLSFKVIVPLWFLTADDNRLLLLLLMQYTFFEIKVFHEHTLCIHTKMHSFDRRSSKLVLFGEHDSSFSSFQNHSQCFHSAVISGIFVESSKVENRCRSTKNHVCLSIKCIFCFFYLLFADLCFQFTNGFHRILCWHLWWSIIGTGIWFLSLFRRFFFFSFAIFYWMNPFIWFFSFKKNVI